MMLFDPENWYSLLDWLVNLALILAFIILILVIVICIIFVSTYKPLIAKDIIKEIEENLSKKK